jgi:hypothetical protein
MGLNKDKVNERIGLSMVLLIFIALLSSCNKNVTNGSICIDCQSEEPQYAYLSIKLTLNSENSKVPLVIYGEKFDPSKNLVVDTALVADSAVVNLLLPTNQYYSVKAQYKSGEKIIYAIDGSSMDTQRETACDNTCWQVVGGNLDVRLKY